MHFLIEFIRSRVPPDWRQNSTGWISGNCPVCTSNGEARPDTKRRGGFHFEEDEFVYHCFNCGYKTGWKPGSRLGAKVKNLMQHFGVSPAELQRINLGLMQEEETTRLLNPQAIEDTVFKPDWPEASLPEGSQFIYDLDPEKIETRCEAGIQMLADRQLLNWTDWAYTSKDWKFKKRMILPYRRNGVIVGYNARYIGNPPEGMIKYYVQKPKHFVFNLDRQTDDRQFVIVTEGDFDAIGIDGVGVGTNTASDEQVSIINQLNRRVILLPDGDSAGNKLVETALKFGWSVSYPEWIYEFKDANAAIQKYGRSFVLQSTVAAAIDNQTKIRVLARRFD